MLHHEGGGQINDDGYGVIDDDQVEYSKMENLKVRENGPMSWDFTKPGGGYQDNQVEDILAFSMLSNFGL